MALLQNNKKQFIYLYEHHTLGRLAEKVDTRLDGTYVSRIHAVLQWQEPHWFLRDLSSNGTWLNGKKLSPNSKLKLAKNDNIQFGGNHTEPFILKDVSPPADALIESNPGHGNKPEYIKLEPYHFLPSEEKPEVIIYKKNTGWSLDELNSNSSTSRPVENGSILQFAQKSWELKIVQNSNITAQIEEHSSETNNIQMTLNLSLDEEHCSINIIRDSQTIELGSHSHNLLTAMLARYRASDVHNNLPVEDQGWVYTEQLSKDMGLEERHINIQIHRARKEFSERYRGSQDYQSRRKTPGPNQTRAAIFSNI